jgi:hypothetical protein
MSKFTNSKCVLFLIPLLVYIFQGNIYAQEYDFEQTDDQFGLVVMEAEHFTELIIQDENSTWDSIFEPAGFSGTSAMQASPADPLCTPYATKEVAIAGSAILSYKIKFVKTGTVYICTRECHTNPEQRDDSFHAGIDDEIPETSDRIAYGSDILDQWYWVDSTMDSDRAYFAVEAGIHDFKIYIRECGLRIDKIVLTTDESYDPELIAGPEGPPETLPAPSNVESLVSHKFGLYPAYPNPFSSSTTLSYNLVKSGHVSLNVYDILGHRVATLVDDNQNAGIQEFILNADDLNNHRLADGIYVIELKTGTQNSKIKIQVMR